MLGSDPCPIQRGGRGTAVRTFAHAGCADTELENYLPIFSGACVRASKDAVRQKELVLYCAALRDHIKRRCTGAVGLFKTTSSRRPWIDTSHNIFATLVVYIRTEYIQ